MQPAPRVGGDREADGRESGRGQQPLVVCLRQRSAGATDADLGLGLALRVKPCVGDDVADPQPPARPQHPEGFCKNLRLIAGQIDDAVRDHDVNVSRRKRDLFNVPHHEPDVTHSRLGGIGTGQCGHGGASVQPISHAGRADPPGRQQHVQPAARTEVQNTLARLQVRDRYRVPAAQAGLQR
jgi:hypothetical protein